MKTRRAVIVVALLAALLPIGHWALRSAVIRAVSADNGDLVRLYAAVDPLLAETVLSDDLGMSQTPLLVQAAKNGRARAAASLLAKGANANAVDSVGRTALHYGAGRGDLNTISLLLKRKANPDRADHYGCTPLHDAAECGRPRAVSLLLAAGAHKDVPDRRGESPFAYAVAAGSGPCADMLRTASSYRSVGRAFEAAAFGDIKALRAELEKEPQLTGRLSKRGWSLPAYAARNHQPEALRFLLSSGCRPDPVALRLAVKSDDIECVKLLIAHGANVNAGAASSNGAMSAAAAVGNPNMVRYLLQVGARTTVKCGLPPAEIAKMRGHPEIVRMIESHHRSSAASGQGRSR